jgi:hypothetical protein
MMGDDYVTAQVFVGRGTSSKPRYLLKQTVIDFLETQGFVIAPGKEHEHNRVIAIGPTDKSPWIALYDSIGDLDEDREFDLLLSFEDFVALVKGVSKQFNPAVIIQMNDSCSVSFELFAGGRSVDKFQDSPVIGWLVHVGEWTEEQRQEKAGKPDVWVENFQLNHDAGERLRDAWPQRDPQKRKSTNSSRILDDTAEIVGWNKYYCSTGYNVCPDGIPYNYKVPFSYWGFDKFEELYFNKSD